MTKVYDHHDKSQLDFRLLSKKSPMDVLHRSTDKEAGILHRRVSVGVVWMEGEKRGVGEKEGYY